DAGVVDEPRFVETDRSARDVEQVVAVVADLGPGREPALAVVIEIDIPLRALRWIADAEKLIGIELRIELETKDLILLELQARDVEISALQVAREDRPVKDRDVLDVNGIVAGCQPLLVLDERLAGPRIDFGRAGDGIDVRGLLQILENDLARS